jgi:Tfp pilus assembly protein PilX
VTLVGLLGDLVGHATDPHGHAQETLIVLGRGNNPWHIVLVFGILLTAIGGIRALGRSGSDGAALIAAWLSLLLIATLAVGGVVGWQAGRRANALAARESLATAAAAHSHAELSGQPNAAAAVEGVEGVSQFGGHSHGVAGPTTAAEAKVLEQQLAEAKAASAKYRNAAVARSDGYIKVTQFIPGLGLHMVNLGISQTTFDPTRPQVLLYEPRASGGLRLVGIGYALQTIGDTPPEGFAGGSDVWHFHRNLCFLPDGSVTIAPSAGDCQTKKGFFQARTAWLLHVWVWKTNPNGVFTEANPQVF